MPGASSVSTSARKCESYESYSQKVLETPELAGVSHGMSTHSQACGSEEHNSQMEKKSPKKIHVVLFM